MATTETEAGASTGSDPAVPYRVRNRWFIALLGVFAAPFAIGYLLEGLGAGSTGDDVAFALATSGIVLAIWWRGGWVSIRVEERQLKVRNVWRRHRISWHDIDRFEPRLEFRLHRMGVVTTDGRRIPMAAITLHGDGTRGWGVDITERLRAHRDAVRAGRPAGDVPAGLPPIRSRQRRSDRQPTS